MGFLQEKIFMSKTFTMGSLKKKFVNRPKKWKIVSNIKYFCFILIFIQQLINKDHNKNWGHAKHQTP